MGNKVNLIEEIRNRLETDQGGDLTSIKRIRIGSKEEARSLKDYPIININVLSGEEQPISTTRQAQDSITIEISIFINKKESDSNLLYDTSTISGGLYLLEKVLNVLDKDTSGNIDLTFAGTARDLRTINWSIDQDHASLLIITIVLTVQTISFTVGNR